METRIILQGPGSNPVVTKQMTGFTDVTQSTTMHQLSSSVNINHHSVNLHSNPAISLNSNSVNVTPQLNTRGFSVHSTRTSSNSDSWESDSDHSQWPCATSSAKLTDHSQWQGRAAHPSDNQWHTRTINGSQWQAKHNKMGQWNNEGDVVSGLMTQKRTYGANNTMSMKMATPLVYHRSYATRNSRQGKAYV